MIDPMRQDRNTQRNDRYELRTEPGEDLSHPDVVPAGATDPVDAECHVTWVYSWRRLGVRNFERPTSILHRFPVGG